MRVIGELPNDFCKISLFRWNEKYLVKFELGLYEQTFKIDEYEVADAEELKSLISEAFIKKSPRPLSIAGQCLSVRL